MKTPTILIIAMMMLSGSCNRESEENSHLGQVLSETESEFGLFSDIIDSEFRNTLGEIDRNLNSINQIQNFIVMGDNREMRMSGDQKEKILHKIRLINSLMAENDKKLEQLRLGVIKGSAETEKLNRIIRQMDQRMDNESKNIFILKEELIKRDFEIIDLTTRIEELEYEKEELAEIYDQLREEMHTAFVVVGTYKDLKLKGIVEKKGGVLKMGRIAELNENFDPVYFNELDTEDSTTIPIPSNDIQLITEHPEKSYEITAANDQTYLHITNPQEFWKASRYLVVEMKQGK